MESGVRILTSTDLSDITSQKMEVYGTIGLTNDGRRFRYVQFGGTVVAGNVLIAPSLVAAHQNCAVQTAAKAGDVSLFLTLGAAAATADQYAGGHLVVGVDGSGVPITRKIKGNTAALSNGTVQIFLVNSEPLLNALTTSNVGSLSPSIYNGLVASSTAGFPIGVAINGAVSGQFGWVQTTGPCGVVNDAAGSLSALGQIKQSTTVAGAVVASTAATETQIGRMVQGAAASKSALAFLDFDS